VKKIFTLLTIFILVVFAYSCSKDHEAPTFSQFEIAKKPTNVVASYHKSTNTFTVSWDMADETDVIDYYIAIADSANFEGISKQFANGGTTRSCSIKADFIPANETTAVRYFGVSAVYSNANVKAFIGPQSDKADTALFVR